MKKLFFVIFFLFLSIFVFSNAPNILLQTIPDSIVHKNKKAIVLASIDSLLGGVTPLLKSRDYAQALMLANEAEQMALKELDADHAAYGKCLYYLGNINYYKQEFKSAEDYITRSLSIRTNYYGEKSKPSCESMNLLASIYWRLAKYGEAEEIYKKLLVFYTDLFGKEHRKYIKVIKNLGGLNGMMGRYEEAEPYFIMANDIYEKTVGKEHPDYLNNLRGLGLLYSKLGNYRKAEAVFIETESIRAKVLGIGHKDYGESLTDLGNLYLNYGEFKSAESSFKKAIPIYEKVYGEEHIRYAGLIQSLARAYALQADYGKAEPLFLKTKSIREKVYGKEHPKYAVTINHLGALYMMTERYGEAEQMFKESLDIREKVYGRESRNYFYGLHELGTLYMKTGKADLAEEIFLESNKICQITFGLYHKETALSLSALAKFYFEANDIDQAAHYFNDLLAVTKELKERGGKHLSENEMLSYTATFQAEDDLLNSFNHLHPVPGLLEESFNSHLLYKGFLLEQSIKMNKVLADAPADMQEKYNNWKNQLESLAKQYSLPLAQRKEVDSLETITKLLEKEVLQKFVAIDHSLRPVNWKEMRDKLQPGEVVLDMVQYRFSNPHQTDSTFYSAFLLKHDSDFPQMIPIIKKEELGSLKATKKLYAENSTLQQKAWLAIAPHLGKTARIYYSPEGLFHRINFGAIPIGENKTVADQFELRQLGSAKNLVFQEIKNYDQSNMVIYGGIEYEAKNNVPTASEVTTNDVASNDQSGFTGSFREYRDDGWGRLEWTAKEANELENIYGNTGKNISVKTGWEATEGSFKELGNPGDDIPSPHFIHLATHGYFFPEPKADAKTGFQSADHPLIRSGLIMANANQVWKGGTPEEGKDDGILTAYEITQLDLSNTELVVLSACETGLGDIEGSEGVYGLQRAFKLAGAKYILMSLWSVNDKMTYEFMTSFYEKMTAGETIPEAYRLTQNEMRKKYALPFNPRNWAGFVLVE